MTAARITTATWILALGIGLVGSGPAQGDLVGVSFGNPTYGYSGGPTNWNSITTTTSPVNNLIDESGSPTSFSLTFSGQNLSFFGGTIEADTVPLHTPSLANLNGNAYGPTASDNSFTATVSGLDKDVTYAVYLFGLRFNSGFSQDVTISGADPDITFQQLNSVVESNLVVNGEVGDSTRTLESFARYMRPTSGGEITFHVDSVYAVAGLAVQAIPEASPLIALGLVGVIVFVVNRWHPLGGSPAA